MLVKMLMTISVNTRELANMWDRKFPTENDLIDTVRKEIELWVNKEAIQINSINVQSDDTNGIKIGNWVKLINNGEIPVVDGAEGKVTDIIRHEADGAVEIQMRRNNDEKDCFIRATPSCFQRIADPKPDVADSEHHIFIHDSDDARWTDPSYIPLVLTIHRIHSKYNTHLQNPRITEIRFDPDSRERGYVNVQHDSGDETRMFKIRETEYLKKRNKKEVVYKGQARIIKS